MKIHDFCAQHARIGDALADAKKSLTDTGSYKFKLSRVRDAHRRMGSMLDDAEHGRSTQDEPSEFSGKPANPSDKSRLSADGAPDGAEIPLYDRLWRRGG
jgi:hypothetical protein